MAAKNVGAHRPLEEEKQGGGGGGLPPPHDHRRVLLVTLSDGKMKVLGMEFKSWKDVGAVEPLGGAKVREME